ncbi:dienelactone hydrolase family protein [Ammoniphilus sp. 3BR4]
MIVSFPLGDFLCKNVVEWKSYLYGGQDPNITNLIPAFEEEMKNQGKSFEAVVYPEAKHAFFNDTNPTYDVNCSRDAFSRALDFLNRVTSK